MRASGHTLNQAEAARLVDRVQDRLFSSGPTVSADEIGRATLDVLRTFDLPMFVRYAIDLKQPSSAEDLLEWLTVDGLKTSGTVADQQRTIRVEQPDGTLRVMDRDDLVGLLRDNIVDKLLPRSTDELDELADSLMARVFASQTQAGPIAYKDLSAAIAQTLREFDPLSYFSYVVLADRLDSPSKVLDQLQLLLGERDRT
jgi:transcriptional regulator NrdR family protein